MCEKIIKFNDTPKGLSLKDIILVYNDGISYKSIDINIFNNCPIIYDKYYENNKYYDISITHCPYSFSSNIYFGIFTSKMELYNGNILIIDEENNKVCQFTGKSLDNEKYYRKKDVVIMTLRNSLSLYPDYKYLVSETKNIKVKKLKLYNKNDPHFKKIHPKTLIYGVEYLSSKTGTKKYTAVISKYASEILENNYNYTDSGYYKYFKKLLKKLQDKSAIVTPCFWYLWINFYPDTKIVKITHA